MGRDDLFDAGALERRIGRSRARRGIAADDIHAEARALKAPLVAKRDAACAALEQKLRSLRPGADAIGAAAARARLTLRQIEGRLAPDLAGARRRADEARADVDQFRSANDLTRAALLPESTLLATALLVVLTAVEAIASAPIFADALQGGLAQGYMMAVTISAMNAGVGFLGGYLGLRYLLRKGAAFYLGVVGFVLALGVGVFLNVFAALWRARTMEQAALDAARGREADALMPQGALELLFNPQQGETVVLMILGAIVLTAAFHKGFSAVDDPNPDYGKLERAARHAELDFADLREEARDALEEPLNEAQTAIEESLSAQRQSMEAARKAYDDGVAEILALERKIKAIDAATAALLARQGDAPPSPTADEDRLAAAGALFESIQHAVAQTQARAEAELDALASALDQASARLAGAGT